MTGSTPMLQPWSTRAVNLPEHATNPIHTDAGGRAAGYDGAIVAGTTIYAYLTHPPAEAWGERWLATGGGELRLKRAVLDDDLVECRPGDDGDGSLVEACVGGEVRATLTPWQDVEAPPMRDGDDLPTMEVELTPDQAGYGRRAGDDLGLYAEQGIAHPALWPVLANTVFSEHLIEGPWIHTKSRIFHRDLARAGDRLTIRSTVVDRFETRAGTRALVDIEITAADRPLARIEHEALVRLNAS